MKFRPPEGWEPFIDRMMCTEKCEVYLKGIESESALSTKKRLLMQKSFKEYWETGGFPEVAGLPRHLRIKTHQKCFHTILFRDMVERHDVSHPKALTDLARRTLRGRLMSRFSDEAFKAGIKQISSVRQSLQKASPSKWATSEPWV